jgi:hypothetical protein
MQKIYLVRLGSRASKPTLRTLPRMRFDNMKLQIFHTIRKVPRHYTKCLGVFIHC